MNFQEFYELARTGIVFSDGAMGTMLQARGLSPDEPPELWNLTRPDDIKAVHEAYIEAGAMMLTTNTFGGNRIKLSAFGLQDKLKEINYAGVKIAKEASKGRAIVAASIGPTGKFIKPLGDMTFDEMYEVYKEQIEVLAEAGADVLDFETMVDILELKAAVLAAKDTCDLPIIANVTFEKDGRTVTGSTPEAAFTTLEYLGVDIIGTNCSTGPEDMAKIIKRTRHLFTLPIIAQANAGMPHIDENGRTVFDEPPEQYVEKALEMVKSGVNCIGGCCGTTPEYIKLLKNRAISLNLDFSSLRPREVNFVKLSSRYEMVAIGSDKPFVIIGERLNPTGRKKFARALKEGDFNILRDDAISQVEAGADILDLNVGVPGINEDELMEKALEITTSTVKVPLSIDTSRPSSAEIGMKLYPGKPLLNSVSGETEKLEKLLPLVKRYGAAFIALPVDDRGIPDNPEDRVKVVKKIIDRAIKMGISKNNIIADPLTLTVSADQTAPSTTLKTIRMLKDLGINTVVGLSNVSFGLPQRKPINRAFLMMAIEEGLTSAIMNPLDDEIVKLTKATDVLLGKDKNAETYIKLYGQQVGLKKDIEVKTSQESEEETTPDQKIRKAVLRGDREGIVPLVKNELEKGRDAFELMNGVIIPAIEEVGDLYDKKIYFLPQLVMSAEAVKSAFEVLKPHLMQESKTKTGKIVIATVKGDVHDIGKNIVSIMLQNHGFEVIDLGKDVPNEKILETALKEKADIVMLSALMTTTMERMKEFVELARSRGLNVPVMVGGAAVTKDYAESIGAYYSKDAVEAVKVAKNLVKQ